MHSLFSDRVPPSLSSIIHERIDILKWGALPHTRKIAVAFAYSSGSLFFFFFGPRLTLLFLLSIDQLHLRLRYFQALADEYYITTQLATNLSLLSAA